MPTWDSFSMALASGLSWFAILLRAFLWVLLAVGILKQDGYAIASCAVPLALFYLADIRDTLRRTFE